MLEFLKGLIRKFEGCKLASYLCPAGVWTIGWGSTGRDIGPYTKWTQLEADIRLARDAMAYAEGAATLSPRLRGDDRRWAAIADFCYNLGTTRYKSSTLRRRVDAGDWAGAKAEIMKWVIGGGRKLPGLVTRRGAEADLL